MKIGVMYILLNIFLVYSVNDVNLKSQSFEGSIEYNLVQKNKIIRKTNHVFSEKYYGVFCLYFKMSLRLGDLVFDLENEKRMRINHSDRTIQNLGIEKHLGGKVKSEIIRTDQFIEILGYKCRKYILHKYSSEFYRTTISWIWVAEKLTFEKLHKIAKITDEKNSLAAIHSFSQGIPLRIDFLDEKDEKRGYLEATKIEKKSILEEIFKIPEEYKIVNR